ncbi:hypothetical protein [Micromonospora sp. NPDC005161]
MPSGVTDAVDALACGLGYTADWRAPHHHLDQPAVAVLIAVTTATWFTASQQHRHERTVTALLGDVTPAAATDPREEDTAAMAAHLVLSLYDAHHTALDEAREVIGPLVALGILTSTS